MTKIKARDLPGKVTTQSAFPGRVIVHTITRTSSPIRITLQCKCGWAFGVGRHTNALARKSMLEGAWNKHMRARNVLGKLWGIIYLTPDNSSGSYLLMQRAIPPQPRGGCYAG